MRTLSVYANPYCSLDAEGNPCGAVPCDPIGHAPDNRLIGAVRSHECLTDYKDGDTRCAEYKFTFEFSSEVIKLPDTKYYRDRVQHGELFPADAATAKAAGVPFVEFSVAIEDAKVNAAERFHSAYGEYPPFFASEKDN